MKKTDIILVFVVGLTSAALFYFLQGKLSNQAICLIIFVFGLLVGLVNHARKNEKN